MLENGQEDDWQCLISRVKLLSGDFDLYLSLVKFSLSVALIGSQRWQNDLAESTIIRVPSVSFAEMLLICSCGDFFRAILRLLISTTDQFFELDLLTDLL